MLQALANLSRTAEWKEVDNLLAAELNAVQQRLLGERDDVQTRRLQGMGQLLQEIRAQAANAADTLTKMPRR